MLNILGLMVRFFASHRIIILLLSLILLFQVIVGIVIVSIPEIVEYFLVFESDGRRAELAQDFILAFWGNIAFFATAGLFSLVFPLLNEFLRKPQSTRQLIYQFDFQPGLDTRVIEYAQSNLKDLILFSPSTEVLIQVIDYDPDDESFLVQVNHETIIYNCTKSIEYDDDYRINIGINPENLLDSSKEKTPFILCEVNLIDRKETPLLLGKRDYHESSEERFGIRIPPQQKVRINYQYRTWMPSTDVIFVGTLRYTQELRIRVRSVLRGMGADRLGVVTQRHVPATASRDRHKTTLDFLEPTPWHVFKPVQPEENISVQFSREPAPLAEDD